MTKRSAGKTEDIQVELARYAECEPTLLLIECVFGFLSSLCAGMSATTVPVKMSALVTIMTINHASFRYGRP